MEAAARSAMVEKQLRAGGIADERVLAAMGQVPREEFVPEELREQAYADGALPIGHGQTISQPWVVAAICAALELRGGERVLDVGGGSGYSTAVIAELVRPGGRVRSYELVPELADRREARRLRRLGYVEAEVAGRRRRELRRARPVGRDRRPRGGARGAGRLASRRSPGRAAWCSRSPRAGPTS